MSLGPTNPKPDGYFDGQTRPPDPPAMRPKNKFVDNPDSFSHRVWTHGRDCEPASEDNRWWQAFCAKIGAWPNATSTSPDDIVAWCGDLADAAIAEAKKRGRL